MSYRLDSIQICTLMQETMKGDLRLGAQASSRDDIGGPSSRQLELAMDENLLWENGKILKARFIGGTPKVREMVMKYANSNESWFDFANLGLLFVEDGDADIRITFNPGFTNSSVGTNSRNVPIEDSTMNFGWFHDETSEIEFARTVRHEFGHVMGCIHEHQNPNGNVQWDKPKVYDYYTRKGWTKAKVDLNIFHKYSTDSTNFSEYDEHSIMTYSIPNSLTTNGYCVQRNHALSETDKQWIADAYPHRGYDPSFASNGAAENEAAENEVAKTEAAENEAVKNEAMENKAAENEEVKNKGAKNEGAENKKTENKAAQNEVAKNEAVKNEAAENEAAKNEGVKNEGAKNKGVENKEAENEAAENEAVKNEAVKNQVAENKAVENGTMQNKVAENRAGKNVVKKNKLREKGAGEKGVGQKGIGEKGEGREGAGGKGAREKGPTEKGPTEKGPTEKGPTEKGPTEKGPTENGPTEKGPTEKGPTEKGPTERGEKGWKGERKTSGSEQKKGENKKGRERVKNFFLQLFCCCSQSQRETESSEPPYVSEKLDESMDERW